MILDETKVGSGSPIRSGEAGTREPDSTEKADQQVQDRGPAVPDLEALAWEICSDATRDPVFYLLRSNTAHDGE